MDSVWVGTGMFLDGTGGPVWIVMPTTNSFAYFSLWHFLGCHLGSPSHSDPRCLPPFGSLQDGAWGL